MSATIRNTLLLVALLVILGVGYFMFIADDDAPLSSGISGSEQVQLETQILLSQLQELQQIKIDQSVFSDARFTALRDFRQQLLEEPSGRVNPFAPTP